MPARMFLLCLLAFSPLLSATAQSGHTLHIESTEKKVTYALDGLNVPLGKLLDLAGEMVYKNPQSPIAIVFDGGIPFDVVSNAKGIFNKAGFQRVTLFVLSKKTGKMCEVSLGVPVPFIPNPQ